jgi:hypothetical protein
MENAATDNCVRECDTCFFTVIPSRFSPTWTGGTAAEPVMTVVGLTYRTESLGGLDQQYLLSCVARRTSVRALNDNSAWPSP